MSTGQVKWFNNAKGFGFILPDEGGEDLFAHYSAIGMDGYKTLKAGQMVTFDKIEGPKGLHASNIRTIGESEASTNEPVSDESDIAENTDNSSSSSEEEEIIDSEVTIEAETNP